MQEIADFLGNDLPIQDIRGNNEKDQNQKPPSKAQYNFNDIYIELPFARNFHAIDLIVEQIHFGQL